MRTTVLFIFMLILSAAMLFAPHHHRQPDSFKDCTLGEIYASLFKDADWMRAPKLMTFLLFVLAGMFATLFPALLVLMLRTLRIEDGHRGGALFILAGVFAIFGTVANLIGMLISHANFMTGAPSHEETAFLGIIPIVQIAFALLSIVIGCSIHVSHWASRLVVA